MEFFHAGQSNCKSDILPFSYHRLSILYKLVLVPDWQVRRKCTQLAPSLVGMVDNWQWRKSWVHPILDNFRHVGSFMEEKLSHIIYFILSPPLGTWFYSMFRKNIFWNSAKINWLQFSCVTWIHILGFSKDSSNSGSTFGFPASMVIMALRFGSYCI